MPVRNYFKAMPLIAAFDPPHGVGGEAAMSA
jgi:hypothetical protein